MKGYAPCCTIANVCLCYQVGTLSTFLDRFPNHLSGNDMPFVSHLFLMQWL